MDMKKIEIMGQAIKAGDEMVSLTDLWKASGRTRSFSPGEWMSTKAAKNLIEKLGKGAVFTSNRGTMAIAQVAKAYEAYLASIPNAASEIIHSSGYSLVTLHGISGVRGSAIIDSIDTNIVKGMRWNLSKYGYAVCRDKHTRGLLLMHRLIVSAKCGEEVDHISRDKLDNRSSNLRIVTRSQNGKNLSLKSNNTSGVSGVYWHKQREKWCARITVEGKTIALGLFDDIETARRVRKIAEIKYFGEFAPDSAIVANVCDVANSLQAFIAQYA